MNEGLSPEIEKRLARAIGVYLKATPAKELPGPLRTIRNFTPAALAARRAAVLAGAEDPGLRARIVEWLDEAKTPLKPDDAALLRSFAARPDGWEQALAPAVAGSAVADAGADETAVLRRRLERATDRARRAREEVAKARAGTQKAEGAARAETAALRRRTADLEADLAVARRDLAAALSARAAADRRLETERRRAKKAAETAAGTAARLRGDLRTSRARVKELEAALAATRRPAVRKARARSAGAAERKEASPRARAPLPVPKGRPGDDPETLEEWLATDNVTLLVDGYNVTKAVRGYGNLTLERQRDRLLDDLATLSRRSPVPIRLVFDGAERGPAGVRRRRGLVKIDYSRPPDKADDHLVALVVDLPPDPVVVVTNDRELQERCARHGATIASSDQLLALIRR